jgi:hypothetical protein
LIYDVGCNGLIPWATLHHDYESDKLSPPATKRVGSNANSPIKTNGGQVEVTKAYYHYKQLTRAGQPGMGVASVTGDDSMMTAVAFAAQVDSASNAFVLINRDTQARDIWVAIAGDAGSYAVRTTTDVGFGDQNFGIAAKGRWGFCENGGL